MSTEETELDATSYTEQQQGNKWKPVLSTATDHGWKTGAPAGDFLRPCPPLEDSGQ